MTPTRAQTSRKLFGIYLHACVSHSAFLLRLASHRSTNAEMFERLFEELTDITRKTWNNRVESLVSNAVLHMQAEKTSGGNTAVTCIIRHQSWETQFYPKMSSTHMLGTGRLTFSLLLTSSYQEKEFGGEKLRMKTVLSSLMVLRKLNSGSKDLPFTTFAPPISEWRRMHSKQNQNPSYQNSQ